ncbi:MAG: DJ-1 family protein [Verrucomicrobia bacterium]|nr:MAG: DJ-1 family protein [Verrucomicrobiota bacterium]
MKTAAVVIFEGFEEVEAVAPVDILRRAGVCVKLVAVGDRLQVCGRSSITVCADALFSEIAESEFDAAVLVGGPGVRAAASDARLIEFFARHFRAGKITAAICAAPGALCRAGVFSGARVTAHPSAMPEISNADIDERADVVRDGNAVTSRGAGTAMAFALEIASALEGAQKALEVSSSICYTPRL